MMLRLAGFALGSLAVYSVQAQSDDVDPCAGSSARNLTLSEPALDSPAEIRFLGDEPVCVLTLDSSTDVESFSLSGPSPVGHVVVRGAPNLRFFTSNTTILETLELIDLPALSTIRSESWGLAGTHALLRNLPNLTTVELGDRGRSESGHIEIDDVGLESLDAFFAAGSRPNGISARGVPEVKNLTFALRHAGDVSLSLRALRVSVWLDCADCNATDYGGDQTIRTLDVRGGADLRKRSFSGWQPATGETVVETARLSGSGEDEMYLPFKNVTNLVIQNNPRLERLWFSNHSNTWTLDTVEIVGNSELRLETSQATIPPGGYSSSWRWPNHNVSSMVFKGPFAPGFFVGVTVRNVTAGGREDPRFYVTDRFEVESTLTNLFNCDYLNGQRRQGQFQGTYLCNGATTEISAAAPTRTSLAALVIPLVLGLCFYV